MDVQQFWNWFWVVFAIIMVLWMNFFFYSLGWRRGWATCIAKRNSLKKVVHMHNYNGHMCLLDHRVLVDEIVNKAIQGYHTCPRCGSWLISLGTSIEISSGERG